MIFAMRDNQKGYTLIEVMVVVMIIALLLGVVIISVAQVHTADMRKASNSFNSMISQTRVSTMSGAGGGNVDLILSSESDGIYGTINHGTTEFEKEKLADSGTEVLHVAADGTSSTAALPITITFNNQTGAFTAPLDTSRIGFKTGDVIYYVDLVIATGYHEVTK